MGQKRQNCRSLHTAVAQGRELGGSHQGMRLRSGKDLSAGANKRKRPSKNPCKTCSISPRSKHKKELLPNTEIMAEPAETLEDEVRHVEQELKAATEKQDRLSTALDELETSGESNPGKHARLEAQFYSTTASIAALTEQLSELNKQLSKKRNLELTREELELQTERETRELENKKQRLALQEQEQKQAAAAAEPVYATALEWVKATQPCKVPPPGPPDVLKPSNADLTRIAREPEIIRIWELLKEAAHGGRVAVSFIHGGPGTGKTFTAYHIMLKDSEDLDALEKLDPTLREFAENTQFVAISFNNITPVQEGRENQWMKDYNPKSDTQSFNVFMPVTARLLYQYVHEQLDFPSFCNVLLDAIGRNYINAHMLGLKSVINSILKDGKRSSEGNVVLIVDELAKLDRGGRDEGLAEKMRSALCGTMDRNFKVLFTSLSDELMKKEYTASHRPINVVALPPLPMDACTALLRKQLETKQLVDTRHGTAVDKDSMALSLARMCWGHPRSLEVLFTRLRNATINQPVHELMTRAVENISRRYTSIDHYPITVLRHVLLAERVNLTDSVVVPSTGTEMTFDQLIAGGFLVNSTSEPVFVPFVSELMLRAIVHRLNTSLGLTTAVRRLVEHLKLLLDALGLNFEYYMFEKLLIYWELVRRNCTSLYSGKFGSITVAEYFQATHSNGDLTKARINVVASLTDARAFPKDQGRNECVPRPDTPELTTYAWFPSATNFPGIDSALFMERIDPPPGAPNVLPVVLQAKFSEEDASTTLNLKTVTAAYERTCKIMHAAGWGDNWVLVFAAWRGVNKNVLENLPNNVIVLTRANLAKSLGCLGAIVEMIHLREIRVRQPSPSDVEEVHVDSEHDILL